MATMLQERAPAERFYVATRVDDADRRALGELARANDRSLSAEIRRALRLYIERERERARERDDG